MQAAVEKRTRNKEEFRMFEECLKPFMEEGTYYTSGILEHDIPLRFRKTLYKPISHVLSVVFHEGNILERKDTRLIAFYKKYHVTGKYAYRIPKQTTEIPVPAETSQQTSLKLSNLPTIHDVE